MTREELSTASDLLESAAESATDENDADRLSDLSDRVDRFATADRGPDHGQLARLQNALHDLSDSAGDDAVEAIGDAQEHIKEYRSGVEGV